MATVRWIGGAKAIAQVDTLTPANVEIDDVFTVTINGKDVSVAATAATVANVTALLADAINEAAAEIPEFADLQAVDLTTRVEVTAQTKGRPFLMAATAANGVGVDTQTHTQATATAATGPNHFDNADNWSTGSVPVDGDAIVFDASSTSSVLYGLAQSAVTPLSIGVDNGFAKPLTIGLPATNETGIPYPEYLPTYLSLGNSVDATNITVAIGDGIGEGSGQVKIDVGTSQSTWNIRGTGQRDRPNVPALLILGTHASNEINISKGDAGIAYFAGEAATVATLRSGYQESPSSDVALAVGSGVTLGAVEIAGGVVAIACATTTLEVADGVVTITEGDHAAVTIDGGRVVYRSTGTIAAAVAASGGTLDFSQDQRARTVTNCDLFEGFTLLDPHGTVEWTNGIDLHRCRVADGVLDLGGHIRLTKGAVA